MDKISLEYYKIIGKIQLAINKSETLEDALCAGLKIMLESSSADAGIIWYQDHDDDGNYHPYYWICPLDITSKIYQPGKGLVGEYCNGDKSLRLFTYEKGMDEITDNNFEGMNITSMVCVPFEISEEFYGGIQFLAVDGKKFTEETADICEIMTMMSTMTIKDNEQIALPYRKKEILLSAHNIEKEFHNGDIVTKVLKGANIDIYKGEFLAVLGESGCGKSTLLNIIGGLDQPTDGSFTFMGKDMSHANQEELTAYRRDNIGFIFQSYNLMNNLNAKQNLDLIGELVKEPRDSEEVLKLVKLEDKMTNYPSQLSGGQQQRVSIARALIKQPKLILADEPTAALDYTTSIEVLSVLSEIIDAGTTLVMVTHNEEIARMADRIVRIRDGRTYEVTVNRNKAKATDLVW